MWRNIGEVQGVVSAACNWTVRVPLAAAPLLSLWLGLGLGLGLGSGQGLGVGFELGDP